jgi:monovalent cation:H+ antiporter, CPA1 family
LRGLVHTTTIDLLIVAVVVALIAHRFRLPYTVGLVLTGIALTFIPMRHMPFLTHDVIFDVILPPLLFEAAISIHWNELRRDAGPILILGAAWPLRPSLLFGVLIAATDPVAVVATFKDNDIRGRLRLLVETESFLNDGVAAVLFSLVLTWIQASASTTLSPVGIARTLALMAGGSIFTGLLCGGLAIVVAGRTGDHLVESTLTTIVAYGSFLLAEHFHSSGVLATVTAGLIMGNLGLLQEETEGHITPKGREFTLALWDFFAFVANSIVFLLIGLTVASIPFSALDAWSAAEQAPPCPDWRRCWSGSP